jgi:glucokinase
MAEHASKDVSSVIGVDVGATKILVGCVGRDGTVLCRRRYAMKRENQTTALNSIHEAIEDFMRAEGKGFSPSAMGVGLVGHVDAAAGIWRYWVNLPIHTPIPLAAQLNRRYQLPVVIDNDVQAATLAEMHLGVGRETEEFIYINIGTGVAAGIVCNGQLVRGVANYAGELGHMVVDPDGDLCPCGRQGCLEMIGSGGGLSTSAQVRLADYPDSLLQDVARTGQLSARDVFQAAAAGDPLAESLVERAVRNLGGALVNLLNLLNPEAIVFGGGTVRDGWLVERLRECVTQALSPAQDSLRTFALSELPTDQVGLLGAATLAWTMGLGRKSPHG